jgi:hypothetical protein
VPVQSSWALRLTNVSKITKLSKSCPRSVSEGNAAQRNLARFSLIWRLMVRAADAGVFIQMNRSADRARGNLFSRRRLVRIFRVERLVRCYGIIERLTRLLVAAFPP